MFDYINYLSEKLNELKESLSETYPELSNVELLVESEQAFMDEVYKPNLILVIVKQLSSSITYEGKTQPIQLTVVADDNTIQNAETLLNEFTTAFNWRVETFIDNSTSTYVKQQYSSPIVMSNFNDVGIGFKSLLYIPATLFITEGVVDINNFEIDNITAVSGQEIKPINFQLNYSMQGNTQPIGGEKLARTVKSVSTLTMSFTLPCKNYYTSQHVTITKMTIAETSLSENLLDHEPDFNGNFKSITNVKVKKGTENVEFTYNEETKIVSFDCDPNSTYSIYYDVETSLTRKILTISNGRESGNDDFNVSFNIGNVPFNFNVKLSQMEFVTAPNAIPALNLGFQV